MNFSQVIYIKIYHIKEYRIIIIMNFLDYLYYSYDDKKLIMNNIEKKYFTKLNENMIKKSLQRIDEIKNRIINDISKNNFNKKYQIRSLIEYNMIKEFYEILKIDDYELSYCYDEKDVQTNKLLKIVEGPTGECCRDCDRKMKFINKKTKVKYCYFNKKKNNIV